MKIEKKDEKNSGSISLSVYYIVEKKMKYSNYNMRFRIMHILSLTVDITKAIFVVTSTINGNGINGSSQSDFSWLLPSPSLPYVRM